MKQANIQQNNIQSMKLPTTFGCGALLVWSLYALVVSELLGRLPIFQTLFLMFSVSFIAMAVRLTVTKRWYVLKQQAWYIWVIGVFGVCGSDVAYISAVKYAPPAHVDFIDYLWPFFVILFSSFLPKEKLTLQHLIAGTLGFLGVFLMLSGGKWNLGLQSDYFLGYAFAFTAALVWSLYTIAARWYQDMPIEIVGMFCGIGALITLGLHGQYETWVVPTPFEAALVFMLGLASGVAYLLWTYATQKGNVKLLSVLAYFTPVVSMSFLVLCGKEPMSIILVIACAMVIGGVVIGSLDWARIRTSLQLAYSGGRTAE